MFWEGKLVGGESLGNVGGNGSGVEGIVVVWLVCTHSPIVHLVFCSHWNHLHTKWFILLFACLFSLKLFIWTLSTGWKAIVKHLWLMELLQKVHNWSLFLFFCLLVHSHCPNVVGMVVVNKEESVVLMSIWVVWLEEHSRKVETKEEQGNGGDEWIAANSQYVTVLRTVYIN